MAGSATDKLLRNWEKLADDMRHKFKDRLAEELETAHRQAGELFVRKARLNVARKAGRFAPNAPLTKALKGSDVPLVDRGSAGLLGAITYNVVGPERVEFGAHSPKTKKGRLVYEILHNGATLKVTPKALRYLHAKLRERANSPLGRGASEKRQHRGWIDDALAGLRASRGGTAKRWIIPPRPFLAKVYDDPSWIEAIEERYAAAVERAADIPGIVETEI